MIKTLKNIFQITASQKVNQFIYYFKRIPLLGKILPDSIYQDGALKIVISALIYVFITSFLFLKKAFYLACMVVFPIFLMIDSQFDISLADVGIQMLVVLNFIIGALQNPLPLKSSKDKYCCVKLLGMRSNQYCKAVFLYEELLFFVTFLPSFILLSLIAQFPIYKGILLLVMLMCARVTGTALHMALFARIKRNITTKWWFSTILYSFVLFAYVPPLVGYTPNWSSWFVSFPIVLGFLLVGGLSFWYLMRYRFYTEAVQETIRVPEWEQNKKALEKEARFANVKLKEKDLELKKGNLASLNRKKGYEYLNALFFQRHKRLLFQPILIRLAVIVTIFALFVAFAYFKPQQASNIVKNFSAGLNYFVFIMYIVSIGDKMAKSMFFNCDISLLRYGFYRERSVILKNFWIRLKQCIWYNLIPAIAICLAIEGLYWICNVPVNYAMMIPFYCTILCLSVFFSVHHLFLYYVFQPYTTELDVKNPFFKILNSVVYIVSYICLQLDSVPTFFIWIVLSATIVYIGVALILVNLYAPKMFRVK